MKRPLLFILLAALVLCGCSKTPEPTPEEIHRNWISETLGGYRPLAITPALPPVGPWKLRPHNGSRYYMVRAKDGHLFYVEAYVSAFTIGTVLLGSDKPVYRYHYWEQTKLPLIGTTYRKLSQ